ncbi:unnamed protein product [Prorocentrum cordatum]|uniref:Uncharacterized protein n=1 Tax=Prorocentrum cordatum TaxID=2364126 RepID=A0ABN9TXP2_9DINO|nr:unnamed protein product [Polarella glacialis]
MRMPAAPNPTTPHYIHIATAQESPRTAQETLKTAQTGPQRRPREAQDWEIQPPCAGEKTKTLCMPQLQRVRQMALMEEKMAELKANASAGCPPEVFQAARVILQGGVNLLSK